ncbi:phage holin family protein [Cognatishimia sp. F0-27]|uniref:phage holin family protein n=1 Tax=Cognatishimia sp. F0-27 TaxID=2816855 RepID=UPI001D0C6DF6|nr:phage holin family protein [Cognatishimia sp. F0-27]MCC1493885.1 phage holin family protein [Cognatishimia sp. F0-27]
MEHPNAPGPTLAAIAEHLRGLLLSEWVLAKTEMSRNLRAAKRGLIIAVFGVAIAFSAVFALTAALFLGLSTAGLAPWLAALATGIVLALFSALALRIGLSRLSPKTVAPTESAKHAAETLRLVTEKTHVA